MRTRTLTCREVSDAHDRAAHHRIRHEVFVSEQGVFAGSDNDERDHDPTTVRLVALVDETVVGTVRCYPLGDGRWQGDRLAVLAAFRAGGAAEALVGAAVVAAAARGGAEMVAFVQLANVAFFARLGWTPDGPPVIYAGRPHQRMVRPLPSPPAPEARPSDRDRPPAHG